METGNLNPFPQIQRLKHWLLFAIVAAYILTLLPMLTIAKYNVPFGDDVLFGSSVGDIYAQSGSLGAAVNEAGNVVARYRENWQGTYAGIFLMALHPGVFGAQFYALTPFLMIGALTLATLLLACTVSTKLLQLDKTTCLILAFTILLFSVQFAPSAREAFYWYNGAVYYTFFHCLLLTLLSLLICMQKTRRVGSAILYGGLAILLCAAIAGGNYATALPCFLFLCLNLLWWILSAKNQPLALRRIGRVAAALGLAVFIAGMLVSVSAPGNAIRQAAVNETYVGMSAPVAILTSFPLAFAAVLNRFDVGSVLLIGLIVLFASPAIAKTNHSFRYPAFAILLAFAIFASQFTPTLYAASSPGPHRLRNLVFFNYYWLVCFCTVYLTGAIIRRRERENAVFCAVGCRERVLRQFAKAPFLATLLAACIVAAMVLQRDLTVMPAYLAVTEQYNGTAALHAVLRQNQTLPPEAQIPLPDGAVDCESQLLS